MIKNNEPLSMAESLEYTDKNSNTETLAFIKKFISLKPEEAKELRKKLENLNLMQLEGKQISKIIDVMPESEEDLSKTSVGTSISEEEIKKILDIVKEFK